MYILLLTHHVVLKKHYYYGCVQFTAETLGLPVKEVARMLNKHGMVEWLLSGYGSFHTQGYEYMSELITDKLRHTQEVI